MNKMNKMNRESFCFIIRFAINYVLLCIDRLFNTRFLKPMMVTLEISKRCNAHCVMCESWKNLKDGISKEDILKALSDIRDWIGPYFCLQISGGEPLMYDGIYDILDYCKKKKIICKITTNGYLLNIKNVAKLQTAGLRYLTVSLDSHKPDVHNMIRGTDRIFENAVDGIKCISKSKDIRVFVSTTIMGINLDDLDSTIDYFATLPIKRITLNPYERWSNQQFVDPRCWIYDTRKLSKKCFEILKKHKKKLNNSRGQIERWCRYFDGNVETRSRRGCHKIHDNMIITSNGNVYLGCSRFGSIGNILDNRPSIIWKSLSARKTQKKIYNCSKVCLSYFLYDNTFSGFCSRFIGFLKSLHFYKE